MRAKITILVVVALLFTLPPVLGACNSTVIHANQSAESSDYNITKVCTTEFNSGAFISTSGGYYLFLVLLGLGIIIASSNLIRLLIAIPFNLVVILAAQTNVLFLEATSPELTSVILLLNTLYYFCIAIVMPLLVIPFVYTVWELIRKMLNPDMKDKEWELD